MKKTRFSAQIWLTVALSLLPWGSALAQSPDDLVSEKTGLSYAPLQRLLQQGQWRQANEKTYQYILQASNRESQGWIAPEELKNFPCEDLGILDRLWRQYSNDKFGFTIQFPLFIATGNRPGSLTSIEAYEAFGEKLGWRKGQEWIIFKENLSYNLDAPLGHLPSPRREYLITGGRLFYSNLAACMVSCKLVSSP